MVPLKHELAWSEQLWGRLGGRLVDRLAELPGKVAGAGWLEGAQGGGTQGVVAVRDSAGSGLKALVQFLCLFSGGEHLV